jgi:hypothetical protein
MGRRSLNPWSKALVEVDVGDGLEHGLLLPARAAAGVVIDEVEEGASRLPKVGDGDVSELLNPLTEAIRIGVGVILDLLVAGEK